MITVDVPFYAEAHRTITELPNIIKRIRMKLNMSQSEFAESLGVNQPCIARWETGVRTPEPVTLVQILLCAERLKISG
jgi:DNA-binding transcriptional regulator YiaG